MFIIFYIILDDLYKINRFFINLKLFVGYLVKKVGLIVRYYLCYV